MNLMNKSWLAGLNNYRKLTLEFGDPNKFTTEILDVDINNFNSMREVYAEHLRGVSGPVEILYSGGMDSECALIGCIQNNVPVIAITMRLFFRNSIFNTHDLYYAEKFCRENNIRQVFYDLHVDRFFESGDHIKYMKPYCITMPNAATHLWLIDQCHTFPIIGGDYSWPQTNIGKKMYSPHRHLYCFYDAYMQDNGITGIGNMMSHSLEANIMFIKEHIKVQEADPENVDGDNFRIRTLKNRMLENLGFGKLELRMKSHGWEQIRYFDEWKNSIEPIIHELRNEVLGTISTIKWNHMLAAAIGGEPGENDDYGI